MAADADGRRLANDLTTLQGRSGFLRGSVVFDEDGAATGYRQAPASVPDTAVAEACRRARNERAGIDPSKAIIDRARTHEGAERIDWIREDINALEARDVDLIVMTGNIPSTE
jgi:hypothetical protein